MPEDGIQMSEWTVIRIQSNHVIHNTSFGPYSGYKDGQKDSFRLVKASTDLYD